MSEIVKMDAVAEKAADFTVIATSPAAMVAAQQDLIAWASQKIVAVEAEHREASGEMATAIMRKWDASGWRKQVGKIQKRLEFYQKIKAALEAGYYIVPPFPMETFAIRTSRKKPKRDETSYRYHSREVRSEVLAIGEGRYVGSTPVVDSEEWEETKDGKTKTVTTYYASEFADVGFPFALAKAEIRDATQAAMALGIFDRMGVAPATRSPDPLVCGEIIIPNQPGYGTQSVTFFVAWWLDTKTL